MFRIKKFHKAFKNVRLCKTNYRLWHHIPALTNVVFH